MKQYLSPLKWLSTASKSQVEAPINSAINAENAMLRAWNRVRKFFVRRIINQAKFGVVPFESEDLWLCVTCGNCVQRCPEA